MGLSRREFVVLTSTALAGCGGSGPQAVRRLVAPVDAGPQSDYAADGVYRGFAGQGFFLVRHGGELVALSSVCTHRACRIKARADGSFLCPCHGSTFDPQGHVEKGPATRDLPHYRITIDERRHVIVSPVGN